MAQFIHLADERIIRKIEKSGIKTGQTWGGKVRYVFATPVLQDFMISHQWLRELRRQLAAVYVPARLYFPGLCISR